MSKYHDDKTHASDPGGVGLSRYRLYRLEPRDVEVPEMWRGRFTHRDVFEDFIDEHLRIGDSRAACVVSLKPLLVAAYTDEIDCVVLLNFPDWAAKEQNLKVGDRLLTVNAYTSGDYFADDLKAGPLQLGQYGNYFPIIAEMVSDDSHRIEERKKAIKEEEWSRCRQMGFEALREAPNRWRNGSPFWSILPNSQPVVKKPWWKFWG